MRINFLRALAGIIGLLATASATPAISYVSPINYNATCGISTVFATASISVSTIYVTSLPNSTVTLHEILPSTVYVTVLASSVILPSIYATVPVSYGNFAKESQTATVYVTIPASPISSSSTEAIGVTPNTISETIKSTSTLQLSQPLTTTHTSTRHTTLTIHSSSLVTETLTSSLTSSAAPTNYAVGVGNTVTQELSSVGSSESPESTETIYTTIVITISSCGLEVTNCPYATKPITLTTTMPASPVTSTANTISASASTPEGTSTMYATTVITISSCAPEVKDCPYATKPITMTSTISLQPATSIVNTVSVPEGAGTSTIISTAVITVSWCPPEVTDCPFTTAPLTHTTVYATEIVPTYSCASGVYGCPYGGTNGVQASTTSSVGAIRQSSASTSEAAFSNGYISYYMENSTTHWLNGQTPDASQSYIYVTSVVTVVPTYSTLTKFPEASASTLQSTVHSTTESTGATSIPMDTESVTPLTSTFHSTRMVTASITIPVSAGTGSSYTDVTAGGWNSTLSSESRSSTSSDSSAPTSPPIPYPVSNTTSSVRPTAGKSSSYSIDIYKPHISLISLSTLAAQSGFLHESATSCTDETVSLTTAVSDTVQSYGIAHSTPMHYVAYPILNSTSLFGSTGSVLPSSLPMASSTLDSSPVSTPSSSSMGSSSTPVHISSSASNTGFLVVTTGSVTSSTSSSMASSTSDNSPVGTSSYSIVSNSIPASYVSYPTLNMTSSVIPTRSIPSSTYISVGSSTSENSPIGTSSSSSTWPSSASAHYVPYPTSNITSAIGSIASSPSSLTSSAASDNSPIGTSSSSSYVSTSTASSASASYSAPSSFVTIYSSSSLNSGVSSSITTYGRYSYARTSSSSLSNSTLSSSASRISSIMASTMSDNSPVKTSSATSVYYSTLVAFPNSTVTSSTSSASASPAVCGEQGNFTLNFDDIPPLSVSNGTDPNTVDPAPVFNPYHQFDFSDGFTVVPPPTDPYLPESGKQLLEFIPNLNTNGTNTQTGPNTDELGYSGGISDGDHGLTGCFSFNFYGASLGCDSKGPDCDFTFSGYRLNGNGTDVNEVTSQDVVVPACPALTQCHLTPVAVDYTFQDLVSVRINVAVAGIPKIWWMDDLNLGWFNNSCTTGLCRQSAHIP